MSLISNLNKWQRDNIKLSASEIKTIKEIVAVLHKGLSSLLGAAEKYVKFIDEKPVRAEACVCASPRVPRYFWEMLDMMGRKQLDYRMACSNVKIVKSFSTLPFKKQGELIDHGVDINTSKGVVHKEIADLSQTEVARLVDKGEVVPAKEQMIPVAPHMRKPAKKRGVWIKPHHSASGRATVKGSVPELVTEEELNPYYTIYKTGVVVHKMPPDGKPLKIFRKEISEKMGFDLLLAK